MPIPGAKASSFDSGHHCPLIVVDPSRTGRGIRNQALMNWVDFCPTFLDWCGVAHPDGADALPGRSLLPILADEGEHPGDGAWEETFTSHCFHEVTNYYPYRALRGRKYKYVRNLAHQLPTPLPSDLFRSPSWTAVRDENVEQLGDRPRDAFVQQDAEALFDMQADPNETRNLIADPAHAEVAAEMRRKVMDFRIQTRDPWLEQSFQEGEPGAVI